MKQIVQDQLRQLNIKPNHQLGQNFLIDPTVIETSLQAAQLQSTDTVVEIGPGLGILTEALLHRAQHVIAIECDTQFKPHLQQLQAEYPNLEIIWGDALHHDIHQQLAQHAVTNGQYSVVANLPYQITSHFLQRYLTKAPYPKQMILLIQKEVAERIIAQPGQLSILGLSVQLFCEPEYILTVPPSSFLPPPKVESAIVALKNIRQCTSNDPRTKIMSSPQTEKLFFSLVRSAFAQKRKKLLNNLKHIQFQGITVPPEFFQEQLHELNLSENVRAQELSLLQWLIMVDKVESFIYN